MVNLAFVGFGTVGRALASVIQEKGSELGRDFSVSLKVVAIFELEGAFINPNGLHLKQLLNLSFAEFKNHPDWREGATFVNTVQELSVQVLVEMSITNIETGNPGYTFVKTALERGIHVATANKGPIALYFKELRNLAAKKGCELRYEATVGSGIPVMTLGLESLRGNKIVSILAILNGTSNYILTKMNEEKVPFDIALSNAQELGYAEADPTLDIEGHDAAFKLIILANTFFKKNYTIKDVNIRGIKEITLEAMELASEDNLIIKHIAVATADGKLEVSPSLVQVDSQFAIGGTNNIIILKTDLAKEISITGHGAGGTEAASALLGDILAIAVKLGL